MDTYGRQWGAPATPSRGRNKGHQRYSSLQEPPFPDYYRSRALPGSSESPRSSLPLPGGRPSPKSLPPQHIRRQSAAESQQPHYVTPTRARQHRNANTYPGTAAPIDLGQWEQLRSRGFVLTGAGVQARPTVTFAPALAVIPSQISSSSSSHASTTSSSTASRRIRAPVFQVHPSLRTGYHPRANPAFNRPHNQFMKMPLEAISSHRQPVKAAPPSVPTIRNDIVDAALVPRNAPPAEQAITFHASSFTPDPIYRAHYLAQPSNLPRIASLPQPGSQSGTPQVSNCIPSVLHSERPPSPTRSIFSRPASPDTTLFPPASSTSGCFRSSTLRRQETDQSSYSQATLPEPYLPAIQGLQDIQQASPFVLSSWKPLSVAPVRTKSQDARALWLDLERALLGTPSIGSRATTPSKDRQNNDEQKDVPSVDVGGDETTYDFTQTTAASKPKSPEYQTPKSSLTRPPLVRTDRSEDRLDHHRALACSIIEKAQHSAAASGPMPSQPPVKPFQEAAPHNTSPAVKHVRIATGEEATDEQKPRVTTSRPSKVPRLAARVKVASRIPVPTGTRAGVLQRRRPGIEL